MRNIYFLIVLISFVSFGQKLEGQKLIDSLLVELPKMKEDTLKVSLLNQIASSYDKINPKTGIKFCNQAENLAKKLNFQDGFALALRNYGINYVKIGEFDKAQSYFEKSLKNTQNKKIITNNFVGLGLVFLNKGDLSKALKYNNTALKLIENLNDYKCEASILSNIGIIYDQLGNFNKSIIYYKKSINIAQKYKYEDILVGALGNCGNAYGTLQKLDEAIFYQKECLRVSKNIGSVYNEALALSSLGLIYCDKKEFDNSLKYSFESLELNQKLNNENDTSMNYSIVAYTFQEKSKVELNILKKKSDQKNAVKYYIKAIEIKNKIGNKVDVISDYEALSEIQKLQGNYKASLESHELYVIYKDSVFNSENKETIKNLEDKREIELRDKEIKINKLSLEAKEKQKLYLFGGIGLLAIIGGLLFYQSRKRKQINQKLEVLNHNLDSKNLELDQANKAKTRFFSILNHDLRGPVVNLINFLQLQTGSPEMLDAENTKRMQDKTMTGAENLLASMEDILAWSKSQMENFKPQPKNVLVNQLFDDTKKVFSGYLKISFDYKNPDNIEIFTDENYLKTIVRNLTSNAINVFTNEVNPTIIWKAWHENSISYLSITDNGPGANSEKLKVLFDESEIGSSKSGLGLHLIRDMAKAIDCEIFVESKIGEGTTFILKL